MNPLRYSSFMGIGMLLMVSCAGTQKPPPPAVAPVLQKLRQGCRGADGTQYGTVTVDEGLINGMYVPSRRVVVIYRGTQLDLSCR
jgi:hypothetical protein